MKKAFFWCKIFIKRHLKRPSMIFILLCMMVLSVTLRLMSKDITTTMTVGFYTDDTLISQSLSDHKGMIKFEKYNSTDLLRNDVSSNKLQCGYIFKDGFRNSFLQGDKINSIRLLTPPENIASLLSNVIIMATVMESTACDMLLEDVLSMDFFENINDADLQKLSEEYKKYATNGSTFAFDYDALYNDYTGSSSTINISDYLVTPVRGIVAIFVFIVALTGGLTWYKDKSSFTYANIPLNKTPFIKLLVIATPTVIAMTAGYVSLILAGICTNPTKELYVMTMYGIICIIVTYLLSTILNESIYCGLIPVFILGSVICSPIFYNLANLIPAMEILQKCFLPTYYFML